MRSSASAVRLAFAAAATAFLLAVPPSAEATGGRYLVQIGKLSNGAATGVDPGSMISGLSVNQGAGGQFGAATGLQLGIYDWKLTVPTGTRVIRADVWPSIYTYGWPALNFWDTVLSPWGNWGTMVGTAGEISIERLFGAGGTALSTTSVPSATVKREGFTGGTNSGARFTTDKLDVILADDVDPDIVDAPTAATLFGAPRPSGWYTDPDGEVTATLGDVGAGVRYLLLREGTTLERFPVDAGPSCKTFDTGQENGNSYTRTVPCPTGSQAHTVSVPLSTFGDGEHHLRLGVQDAAGNQRFSATDYDARINGPGGSLPDPGSTGPSGCTYADDGTTCSGGTPAGGGGGGGTGGGGGVTPVGGGGGGGGGGGAPAPTSDQPPAGVPQPNREVARSGNGTDASAAAAMTIRVGSNGAGRVTVGYGRPVVVEGRLTTAKGRPIGGASIDVFSASRATAAATRRESPVTSSDDGSFRVVLPAGPSRTLRFAYRAFADDEDYADSKDLEIRVRTSARLRATPASLRNGSAVRFRGEVRGAPGGSRKVVEMQVLQDGHWLTFGTTRIRHGRFAYRYRFTRTAQRTAYVFRSVIRGDAGWPYDTGTSNRTKVVVRP